MKTLLISLLALITSILCLFFCFSERNKDVYVDTGTLFKEFKMSKELNSKMEIITNEKKRIVDSLYNELQKITTFFSSLKDKPSESDLNNAKLLEQEYYYRQKQFTEENQKLNVDYTTKCWNQLNEYLKEYGKDKNYNFIYGASGEGSLLYANEKLNITNEVVDFVNNKYEGKK